MISHSTAIVLKRFPYGETSIIARCFVRNKGKLSFIVHGARRKKSSKSAHFQPANCLELVYYFKPSKSLQTVSKSSYDTTWKQIPQDFKKISYAMALLELTDKCLTENDPNIELFDELFKALQALENNSKNNNIVFWFFQYQVLSRLGFRPDFSQSDINNTPLPNPYKSRNSKAIFDSFENNEPYLQADLGLTSEDRRTVSNYLNSSLRIHFDGLKNLKSLQFIKETL